MYTTLELLLKVCKYALNTNQQLTFLAQSSNFRRLFLQTKFEFGISNHLPTYGRVSKLSNNLHNFSPAHVLVKLANFQWWLLRIKYGSAFSNCLPTYGRVFELSVHIHIAYQLAFLMK